MMCAWKAFLGILPLWMRPETDKLGKSELQELRLRINAPPELVLARDVCWLSREVTKEDLSFCINAASRYSPWAAATASQGYITAPGGHRIGICGETACRDGSITAVREIHSLNVRVARDFPGIGSDAFPLRDSALIIGPPGSGKTTLLRDISRRIAQTQCVAVVDERGELFPQGIPRGKRMDVLTGCAKSAGIPMVLRSMGPEWIAVDEITAWEDAQALLHAVGCGVKLLATAHAASMRDLRNRPVYRPLAEQKLFEKIIIMRRDKSYCTERLVG